METDQRPEPFPLIEEAEVLALLIRETDGSVLAFALYRSVTDREAAIHVLKKRLSLPVVEFTLSVQQQGRPDVRTPAARRRSRPGSPSSPVPGCPLRS